MSDQARPSRGTRPANRRALILAAATDLFSARGYEHVAISDIAAEVAVSPSALYRHFPSKEQLLVEVVGSIVDDFVAMLAADPDGDVLAQSAAFALDHRATGAIWQRETRHLSPAAFAVAHERMRAARIAFVDAATAGEPRATTTSALAALSVILSPSFHRIELPRSAYEGLLTDLARRALITTFPAAPSPPVAVAGGLQRVSTRANLLAAAVRLFAERTYASVSMEDVARAVGLAPSSLYNHFPTKSDLLLTALNQANGYLQITLDDVLVRSADPGGALLVLIERYAAFAARNPRLVNVLVTGTRNLPVDEGAKLRLEQRQYVGEWVHLYLAARPEVDAEEARVIVQAVLMTMNDLARSPAIAARPDVEQVLALLGGQVLGL